MRAAALIVFRSGIALAIMFSFDLRAARADGPSLDAGVRAGIAGQMHYGSTHFTGNGVDLGVEAGIRVIPSLGIRIGLERGPRLVHILNALPDNVERRALAFVGVAEYHLDRFFVGIGGGWAHETTKAEYEFEDSKGPVDIWSYTTERSGPLVLMRGGMQLGVADRLSMNLVLQLQAQHVDGPSGRPVGLYGYGQTYAPQLTSDRGYGASLGIELRTEGRSGPSTSLDRTHTLFVGPDLGLTGTLNGSVVSPGYSPWDNLAPRIGLDAGVYVTSSTAIVLGAAGSPHMRAGHDASVPPYDNNQARIALGGELHRDALFASAGGGVSRFTYDLSRPNYHDARTKYSVLVYLGGGVELAHGRYRVAGEFSGFRASTSSFADNTYAFTLTFGVRWSNAP